MIIHHIATDGWSTTIIDEELAALYNSFSMDKQNSLPPVPLRYRDYSVWKKHTDSTNKVESQLDFWFKHLQGSKPLELRADFVRPQKLSGRANEIPITIDQVAATALRTLASSHRTSLSVVLLAALRATLFRVTGEDDGTIGVVNANRASIELERLVGFFVNTHALRLPIEPHGSFEDLIRTTRNVMTAALDNSQVPFDKVVTHLSPVRDPSRNPLVQLCMYCYLFSLDFEFT